MNSSTDHAVPDEASTEQSWPDVIAVSGADAERFLQAQLSCDVSLATSGTGRAFGWCTPAGRVRASGWLLREGQRYWLIVGAGCGSTIAPGLQKFVLRDKVEIAVSPDGLVGAKYGEISGEPSGAPAKSAAPDDVDFELAGAPPRRLALPSGRVAATDASAYYLAGIRAGVFELPAGMDDTFIPQMLNLDLTGGVSFTKGCYPGQEIVARTHNLGRVKRRTLRFACSAPPPAAGTAVFSGTTAVGQSLVASAVKAGGVAACELLAVVQLDHYEKDTLCLGDAGGPLLSPLALPYAIPELAIQPGVSD